MQIVKKILAFSLLLTVLGVDAGGDPEPPERPDTPERPETPPVGNRAYMANCMKKTYSWPKAFYAHK